MPRGPESEGIYIIDLGPGAGHDDGRIVFTGTPADLVAAYSTLTGEALADGPNETRGNLLQVLRLIGW